MPDSTVIKDKIIVAVAPVAHTAAALPRGTTNPVAPEAVAAETVRCCNEGASIVHLHVRDAEGLQVADTTWFRETLDRICDETDMIINGSTGGVSDLTVEERCVSLNDPRVRIGSLNMGSVNFGETVYINTEPEIRYWARRMRTRGVMPELEIFNPSMITTALELQEEGVLAEPLHFNFVLGVQGALSADPRNLFYLENLIPAGGEWGLVHAGMSDLSLMAVALGLGARVLRVGFEDGAYLTGMNRALSNADLVGNLVNLIRVAGKEVATPAEARELLRVR
jgi:3-keto-5-aminohexanoate cleavage enzyme